MWAHIAENKNIWAHLEERGRDCKGNSCLGLSALAENTWHQPGEGLFQPAPVLGLEFLPYILLWRLQTNVPGAVNLQRVRSCHLRKAWTLCRSPILIYTNLTPLGFAQIYKLGCQCLHLGVTSTNEIVMNSFFGASLAEASIALPVRGCPEPQAGQIYELAAFYYNL